MLGGCKLVALGWLAAASGFLGPQQRVHRAQQQRVQHVSISMSLLESLGGWLLPVKQAPSKVEATPAEIAYLEEFVYKPQNGEDIKQAETDAEWRAAPHFGPDSERRRAIHPSKVWNGTRPPLPNFQRMQDQSKMDATYGRGKYRTEVWDAVINPKNQWWKSFEPSLEEAAASLQGYYSFASPEAFFEAKGLSFEKACADYDRDVEVAYEAWKQKQEAFNRPITNEEVRQLQWLKERFDQQEFRFRDNILQKRKGQPSLDDEDTGKRFKNDVK